MSAPDKTIELTSADFAKAFQIVALNILFSVPGFWSQFHLPEGNMEKGLKRNYHPNYHPKIKLTIETNPQRFLDTEITHINGTIETRVRRKKTKLPMPWTSNIPKRYKRNSIKTELYRAKRISSNFTSEVTVIRNKFESAGYPKRFVNSIIREFNAVKENEESDFIIPPWRKVLEAYYIVLEKPTLNDQLEPDRLNLFRNGVT